MTFLILAVPAILKPETRNQAHVKAILPDAIEAERLYGIPVAITLAVSILESGAGTSQLARRNKNIFGMRNGSKARRKGRAYRIYNSARESIFDFARNIASHRPYRALKTISGADLRGWANGLERAGYSTTAGYGAAIWRVIESEDLHRHKGYLISWCHEKFERCWNTENRRR